MQCIWSCWPHCARQVTSKVEALDRFKSGGKVQNRQQHEEWGGEVYNLFLKCHLCRTREQGLAFINKVMVPYLKKHGEDAFVQWAAQVYLSEEEYDWCAVCRAAQVTVVVLQARYGLRHARLSAQQQPHRELPQHPCAYEATHIPGISGVVFGGLSPKDTPLSQFGLVQPHTTWVAFVFGRKSTHCPWPSGRRGWVPCVLCVPRPPNQRR